MAAEYIARKTSVIVIARKAKLLDRIAFDFRLHMEQVVTTGVCVSFAFGAAMIAGGAAAVYTQLGHTQPMATTVSQFGKGFMYFGLGCICVTLLLLIWRLAKASCIWWRLRRGTMAIVPVELWESWTEACVEHRLMEANWVLILEFPRLLRWYAKMAATIASEGLYLSRSQHSDFNGRLRMNTSDCAEWLTQHFSALAAADSEVYDKRNGDFKWLLRQDVLPSAEPVEAPSLENTDESARHLQA